jgi:hypothetical protein
MRLNTPYHHLIILSTSNDLSMLIKKINTHLLWNNLFAHIVRHNG